LIHTLLLESMAGFAGAVMLTDLDDFIAPSQACTNPLFVSKPDETKQDSTPDAGVV
jgi:hypothetical protein